MPRSKKVQTTKPEGSYFEKLESEVRTNQSTLSLVLGALIVLVVGILVFNYFNKPQPQLGPAQQSENGDVSPENLPGKYTVKEGDTLFVIADKYYKDGYKFTEIAKANNMTNPDAVEVGQVLEVPKLEGVAEEASPAPSESPTPTATPATSSAPENVVPAGEKGADMSASTNMAAWGPKIDGGSYTVAAGDWLSTIAARAYGGDVMAFDKIAKANNITNPNVIEPGQVLKLPR